MTEGKYKTALERVGYNHYSNVHTRINKKYGKAHKCEICNQEGKKYQWALRKGKEYEVNIENFMQLCISCHRAYDFNEEVSRRVSQTLSGRPHLYLRKSIFRIGPNDIVVEYDSISIAAEQNNILKTSICNALKGWAKTAGGYKWKYK